MAKKVTSRVIARLIGVAEASVSYSKKHRPKIYELYRLGALCKVHRLTEEELKRLIDLKEKIKELK